MKTTVTVLALAAALAVTTAWAQDTAAPTRPSGASRGGIQGGQGVGQHRPPPMPLLMALDANHDGVIDAGEIANATAALKTLDANGDGKLTREEFMPPRPPRPGMGSEGRGPGDAAGAPPPPPPDGNDAPPPPPVE